VTYRVFQGLLIRWSVLISNYIKLSIFLGIHGVWQPPFYFTDLLQTRGPYHKLE